MEEVILHVFDKDESLGLEQIANLARRVAGTSTELF